MAIALPWVVCTELNWICSQEAPGCPSNDWYVDLEPLHIVAGPGGTEEPEMEPDRKVLWHR